MALSDYDYRILSRPHDVWWDGWKTDTVRLQQAGWEISAEQDIMHRMVRLALRNQRAQMYGITSGVDVDFFRYSHMDVPLEFRVIHMANRLTVQIMDNNISAFKPIDALPQFITTERKDIEDFNIFATPLVRTEEIIVEPKTVESLLAEIKKLQDPEQAAIRARQRMRENREGMRLDAVPRQQFHAQILSIAA